MSTRIPFDHLSQLDQLAAMPPAEAKAAMDSLSPQEAEALMMDWGFIGRPSQQAPPGEWVIWLLMSGRGFGKTRACAEWIRLRVEQGFTQIALVARTARDTREVMIDGSGGLMSVFPKDQRPVYQPSRARVVFHTGAIAHTYGADEPSLLRGPEHDTAWLDELASWQYEEAYDNLMLGLRLGRDPRAVIGTTPKANAMMRRLLKQPGVVVTRGSTYENLMNLAPAFRQRVVAKYEGTRLGRQELYGELLEDTPGALWTQAMLEATRVSEWPTDGDIYRTVVAVDPPAGSDEETAAECGIVAVGLSTNGHAYVIEDASMHGRPHEWAMAVKTVYHKWRADRVVAEANQGGEMVGYVLASVDRELPVQLVYASKAKMARAEPVSALYEQGRVHHIGYFPELEDQLTTWVPGNEKSPDRLDALVWALHALYLEQDESDVQVYDDRVRISPV